MKLVTVYLLINVGNAFRSLQTFFVFYFLSVKDASIEKPSVTIKRITSKVGHLVRILWVYSSVFEIFYDLR